MALTGDGRSFAAVKRPFRYEFKYDRATTPRRDEDEEEEKKKKKCDQQLQDQKVVTVHRRALRPRPSCENC